MLYVMSLTVGVLWFALGNVFQIMARDGATAIGGFFFCLGLLLGVSASVGMGRLARG